MKGNQVGTIKVLSRRWGRTANEIKDITGFSLKFINQALQTPNAKKKTKKPSS